MSEEALNLLEVALERGWSVQHCYMRYDDGTRMIALRRGVKTVGAGKKTRESYEVVRASSAHSLAEAIQLVTEAAFETEIDDAG